MVVSPPVHRALGNCKDGTESGSDGRDLTNTASSIIVDDSKMMGIAILYSGVMCSVASSRDQLVLGFDGNFLHRHGTVVDGDSRAAALDGRDSHWNAANKNLFPCAPMEHAQCKNRTDPAVDDLSLIHI